MILRISLMALVLFGVVICPCYASDARELFPRETKALGVFLKDKSTNEEVEVGRVEAGEGFQRRSLDDCRETAREEAKKRRISDWDYYCCTVTKENDCVTKIKAFQ